MFIRLISLKKERHLTMVYFTMIGFISKPHQKTLSLGQVKFI